MAAAHCEDRFQLLEEIYVQLVVVEVTAVTAMTTVEINEVESTVEGRTSVALFLSTILVTTRFLLLKT